MADYRHIKEGTTAPVFNSTNEGTTPSSNGSGGDGVLGYRVSRLEDDVKDIKTVLSRMEPMLSTIDERLKHLPNTWTFVTMVAVIALGFAAIPVSDIVDKFSSHRQEIVTGKIQDEPQRSPENQ